MTPQSQPQYLEEPISISQSGSENSKTSVSVMMEQSPVDTLKQFFPTIRRIAAGFASKNPSSLDIEDLTSAGVIGLLGAMTRYDPGRETKFWTFAEYRIRGMMLDEMRAMDWVPRSVRARNDQIRQASAVFERKEGRVPDRSELAMILGLSPQELDASSAKDTRLLSLDDPMGSDEDLFTLRDVLPDEEQLDPFEECLSSETNKALDIAMESLSVRQRDVMQRYYFQGLTMKEIGEQLGLTESGICRVHSEAIRRLRLELKDIEETSCVGIDGKGVKKRKIKKKTLTCV